MPPISKYKRILLKRCGMFGTQLWINHSIKVGKNRNIMKMCIILCRTTMGYFTISSFFASQELRN